MTFDNTSTTDDVLSGIDLTGKTAIVTGASGGLGEETARALVAHGASVTILARSHEKLDAAAARIKEATGKKVETYSMELHRPDTVKTFAEDWLSNHNTLDILINNAGVMMCPLERTAEGWEMQFATNHLGHFLLANLMVPALKKANGARVVSVSSGGHNFASVDFDDIHYERREYDPIDSYGQSKTANIWLANELDRRFIDDGIRAFSLHPGGIKTNLGRHMTHEIYEKLKPTIEAGGGEASYKTIPQGAATSCYAATSPQLDGKGGLYLVDCGLAETGNDMMKNHSAWAYDDVCAARLWNISNEMLGTNF